MLDLYRTMYDEQWTRQDGLQSVASASLGLLGLLGSGIVFALPRAQWHATLIGILSLLPLTLAVSSFCLAAFFLFRAIHNVPYLLAPDPMQVRALEDWARGQEPSITPEALVATVGERLAHSYAEAAAANRKTNIDRGLRLFRSNLFTASGLLLILISLALVFPPLRADIATPQQVAIIGPVEVHHDRQVGQDPACNPAGNPDSSTAKADKAQ